MNASAGLWDIKADEIATALRDWRRQNGLSQLDLADDLGWSQSYISKLESGQRSLRNIDELHRLQAIGVLGEVDGVVAPSEQPAIQKTEENVDAVFVASHDLAFHAGRPAQALALLRVLKIDDQNFVDTDDRVALKTSLFEAHILTLIGSPRSMSRAHPMLVGLTNNSNVQHNGSLSGLVALDLGNEFRKSGNHRDGLPKLEFAFSKLKNVNDYFHAAESSAYIACGHAELGDTNQAEYYLSTATSTLMENVSANSGASEATFEAAKLLIARQTKDRSVFEESALNSSQIVQVMPANWCSFYYAQLIAGMVELELPLLEGLVSDAVHSVLSSSLFRPIQTAYIALQEQDEFQGRLKNLEAAMKQAARVS